MLNKSKAGGVFKVACYDPRGNLKWETESHNLVVNEGLQYMNEAALGGGSQTTTWYVGLISGTSPATITATDTLASKAWTEFTDYSGNRKAAVFNTASSSDPSIINNTASKASFTVTASGDVTGAFLCAGATGSPLLFSASNFADYRHVESGDTLNVEYIFSLAAA